MAQKSRKEVRLAVAALHSHLLEGLDPEEIMSVESWEEPDFEFYYRKLVDEKVSVIQDQSIEETYFHYVLDQSQCIRALDDIAKRFGTSKQYNALVGAIKAKSEIHDKIITRGQALELIHKAPKGIKFVGNIAVDGLSPREVKKMMERELAELGVLQNSKLGDTFEVSDDGLKVTRGGGDNVIDITPRIEESRADELLPERARENKSATARMNDSRKLKIRRTKGSRRIKK